MKTVLLILLFFVVLSSGISIFCKEVRYRDPFIPLVGMDRGEEESTIDSSAKDLRPLEPLDIDVQGIVFGKDMRQVIIDGEVYREGDSLRGKDAKVLKINKDGVSVFYSGIVQEETVSRKQEEKK